MILSPKEVTELQRKQFYDDINFACGVIKEELLKRYCGTSINVTFTIPKFEYVNLKVFIRLLDLEFQKSSWMVNMISVAMNGSLSIEFIVNVKPLIKE